LGKNSVGWQPKDARGMDIRASSGDGIWKLNKIDGVDAVSSARNPDLQGGGRYLYFNVDDAFAYDLYDKDVAFSVTYRDTGCSSFYLEYDSSNPDIGLFEGAFRPVGNVKIENDEQWKTATFDLKECRFMNRCNGVDFRLTILGGELTVKKATLIVASLGIPNVEPAAGLSRTFSIVAVDPNTGVCGAAVASKYPAVGKVVPYVRAGVGAFCTQHWHNPPWGELALDMLEKNHMPEQVLSELLRDDTRRDKRQLAIIDMSGRVANHNPTQADPSGVWWGSASGKYYSCQGNTLAGQEVIFAMARAYEQTEGSLADRLMAALVAGDTAGGDHRGRLAAGIRVAKEGIEGYWLELYVDKSDDAVADLAKDYAALDHEARGKTE
jgi:uncharacterized Ntn-hydrolase superfamily protein